MIVYPTYLIAFVMATTIMFALLGMVWKKSDWLNAIIKLYFIVSTVWGVYCLFNMGG